MRAKKRATNVVLFKFQILKTRVGIPHSLLCLCSAHDCGFTVLNPAAAPYTPFTGTLASAHIPVALV